MIKSQKKFVIIKPCKNFTTEKYKQQRCITIADLNITSTYDNNKLIINENIITIPSYIRTGNTYFKEKEIPKLIIFIKISIKLFFKNKYKYLLF